MVSYHMIYLYKLILDSVKYNPTDAAFKIDIYQGYLFFIQILILKKHI